jgi:hypothetical protein
LIEIAGDARFCPLAEQSPVVFEKARQNGVFAEILIRSHNPPDDNGRPVDRAANSIDK